MGGMVGRSGMLHAHMFDGGWGQACNACQKESCGALRTDPQVGGRRWRGQKGRPLDQPVRRQTKRPSSLGGQHHRGTQKAHREAEPPPPLLVCHF